MNARSLRNKIEVFADHVIGSEIDICVNFTNTWLQKRDDVILSALTPPGYSFKNISRMVERTGSGTGIMLRDTFKLTLVEGKERLSFESSKWNVSGNGKTTKFVIVYRPPYSEAHPVPTSVFFDEFAVYLEGVVMCPEVLVIAGDFNLRIDDPENADTRRFFELLETFRLVQHVNFSTHISGHWLNLIISRSSNDIIVMAPKPSLYLTTALLSVLLPFHPLQLR